MNDDVQPIILSSIHMAQAAPTFKCSKKFVVAPRLPDSGFFPAGHETHAAFMVPPSATDTTRKNVPSSKAEYLLHTVSDCSDTSVDFSDETSTASLPSLVELTTGVDDDG